MKKSLFFITIIFGLLSFSNLTYAQLRPTIPPIQPDPTTGCTGYETETRCHPEWTDALNNCVPSTFNAITSTCTTANPDLYKIFPTVNVCSALTMSDRCKPQRYNIYASADLARRAEIMGRELGFDISCNKSKESIAGPDNNTHLNYYYNTFCTIEGIYGFDADVLVNDPARNTNYTNWDVTATSIKTTKAIEECGKTNRVPFFNSDGTYRCITPTAPTTPIRPITPTTPALPSGQITDNQQLTSYANALISVLNKMIANLKSQLGSTGGTQNITTPQSTTSYTSSMLNTINSIGTNLKGQLNSTANGQTTSGIITVQTGASTPVVELTLGNGLKSGTYAVGETINYQVKMQNVDSVNSYYNTIPKDSCVGGSASGEQKPWVVKTVSPLSNFSAKVESCQAGVTYIISVVGTNKTSGIINASSASVYIRN